MKFVVDIDISVQSGFLHELSRILFQSEFSINQLQLKNKDNFTEEYMINLVYSNKELFDSLLSDLQDDPRCISLNVSNQLEEQISQGLYQVKSRLDFKNEDEFETNHTGAYELLLNKVSSSEQHDRFLHRAVLSLSGYRLINNQINKSKHEYKYISCEKEAAVITRFSNINAFPLVVSYPHVEDFTKTIKLIEENYDFILVNDIEDEDDPELYTDIQKEISIPLISTKTVLLPILFLSALFHCVAKYRIKISNTNIGIIGLDSTAIRLTELCNSLGCLRVLGYDNNDKSMMLFENRSGLATTRANILENCDVLFVLRDLISEEDLHKIRPGIIAISSAAGEGVDLLRHHKSCKYMVDSSSFETSLVLPGIVSGLLKSEEHELSNENLIALGEMLLHEGDKLNILPSVFSDIHSKVEGLITGR